MPKSIDLNEKKRESQLPKNRKKERRERSRGLSREVKERRKGSRGQPREVREHKGRDTLVFNDGSHEERSEQSEDDFDGRTVDAEWIPSSSDDQPDDRDGESRPSSWPDGRGADAVAMGERVSETAAEYSEPASSSSAGLG